MNDLNWPVPPDFDQNNSLDSMAQIFLMTPDMSCTNQQLDMMDPKNLPKDKTNQQKPTRPTQGVETRCICGSKFESELMIQCDSCKLWLHADCVRLQNTENVCPFICIFCQFRIAKSIKDFVKNSFSQFTPTLELLKTDGAGKSKQLWFDVMKVCKDIQGVLHMAPTFLPPQNKLVTESSSDEEEEESTSEGSGNNGYSDVSE